MNVRGAGLILCAGLVAAWPVSLLLGYDVGADVNPAAASQLPGIHHWLGTDHLGRDVLLRLVTASEAFVPTGACAAAVAALLGAAAGAIAGWTGGLPAVFVRQGFAAVASVPRFVLVLLACSILGTDPWIMAVATGVAFAPAVGESVHARIASLRRAEFVLAARAHGLSDARILLHQLVWVNCRGLVGRHVAGAFGFFLLVETTLSYLGGFGVQEPTPSWGNMLSFEFGIHGGNPVAWVAPAGAIWLGVLATALIGQDLEAADG